MYVARRGEAIHWTTKMMQLQWVRAFQKFDGGRSLVWVLQTEAIPYIWDEGCETLLLIHVYLVSSAL